MSDFVVHTVPGSPYGRAVLATLEEKGARYRVAPLAPGGSKSEPHLSRHPFGRIPVLERDGFSLYETQAILRYLDRLLPEPALTPAKLEDAARMDQVMNICDWYLFQGVGAVIGFHRIVAPKLFGAAPDEAAIAAAMPKAHRVANELSRLLGQDAFFGGGQATLADIMIASHLDFLAQTPEWPALTAASANLVSWLDRINARASFKATTWERVAALAKAA
jgi:glutathione S-transferase